MLSVYRNQKDFIQSFLLLFFLVIKCESLEMWCLCWGKNSKLKYKSWWFCDNMKNYGFVFDRWWILLKMWMEMQKKGIFINQRKIVKIVQNFGTTFTLNWMRFNDARVSSDSRIAYVPHKFKRIKFIWRWSISKKIAHNWNRYKLWTFPSDTGHSTIQQQQHQQQ